MAISFKKIIPKPTYHLHMLDRESSYIWEVKDFKITSEPNYRFITTNIISQPLERNIIELEICPKTNLRKSNFLTRTVLIEKIGCEKKITPEEDPITIWSFQEMNPEIKQNNYINTRDFLLIDSTNGRNWVLTECILFDSQIWRMSNWLYNTDSQQDETQRKITIKPKTILQYQ